MCMFYGTNIFFMCMCYGINIFYVLWHKYFLCVITQIFSMCYCTNIFYVLWHKYFLCVITQIFSMPYGTNIFYVHVSQIFSMCYGTNIFYVHMLLHISTHAPGMWKWECWTHASNPLSLFLYHMRKNTRKNVNWKSP